MTTIEFVAGLPKEAAIILRACLSDAGYTPAPALKLGRPSEPESVRAARLGAELFAYIKWADEMAFRAVSLGDEWASQAIVAEFGVNIASLGPDEIAQLPRDRWAKRPADVAHLCRSVWLAA